MTKYVKSRISKRLVMSLSFVVAFGASLPFIAYATNDEPDTKSTKEVLDSNLQVEFPSSSEVDNELPGGSEDPYSHDSISEYPEIIRVKDDEFERISQTYNSENGITNVAIYNKREKSLVYYEVLHDGTETKHKRLENVEEAPESNRNTEDSTN